MNTCPWVINANRTSNHKPRLDGSWKQILKTNRESEFGGPWMSALWTGIVALKVWTQTLLRTLRFEGYECKPYKVASVVRKMGPRIKNRGSGLIIYSRLGVVMRKYDPLNSNEAIIIVRCAERWLEKAPLMWWWLIGRRQTNKLPYAH